MRDELLRELTPQVVGALVRRYGHFDTAEDAVQEALLAASQQWPSEGVPDDPRAWLIRVASRRLTDQFRSEQARRQREDAVAVAVPRDHFLAAAADSVQADADDTLKLLFLCCHPSLTASSQIALTLRAVGGLTTEEIAKAFLTPDATMGQRVSRAKAKIKSAGAEFGMPAPDELTERLTAVLHVLYLIFNEGYTATSGEELARADLCAEALRLTWILRQLLPEDGEVAGLLALMLLTDARRPARVGADGELVPLAEQDRSRWDAAKIADGVELITTTMSTSETGPYQLQAAIAAVHDEASSSDDTDWPQILALYGVLEQFSDNPMVTLNRAVAAAMVHGPSTGLRLLATLTADARIADHHRLAAVRAHLLEMDGNVDAAVEQYERAAERTSSAPERRYLQTKAASLAASRTA